MYYKVVHIRQFSFCVFLVYVLIYGCTYYKNTRNFANFVNLIAKRLCLPASDRSTLGI